MEYRFGFFQSVGNVFADIEESHEELYSTHETLDDAKYAAFERFHLDPRKWDDEDGEQMSLFPIDENSWYFIKWLEDEPVAFESGRCEKCREPLDLCWCPEDEK